MLTRLHHRGWHYLLLGALAWTLFFTNLGGPSLWDIDEGKNTACAAEMMESDNWVIPTFNGELRVDKPALLYWLQIAAYGQFGVNEFAARLPSAVAALLTVLLCYELARSMFAVTTGLLAGVIVAGTPMLCAAARFANPDALLNLFVVLTLAVFWFGRERPRLAWFAALGAAEGLGMLAKGPVGLVLPVGIILLFLFWERRLPILLDRRQLAGVVAFSLIALPWYVRVSVETKGEFARGFFFQHNLSRFVSTMENHRGGPWYYPLVIILGTAPWSIFLAPALWYGFWSAVRQPRPRFRALWAGAAEGAAGAADDSPNAAYRLLTCWIGLFVVAFSLSATKLPNYALPVVVPLAILTARFLDRWRLGALKLPPWVLPTSLASLVLTGVGVGVGVLIAGGAVPVDLLHGRTIAELRPWAALGIFPIMGGLAGVWCLWQGRRTGLILSVAAAGVLLLAPLGARGMALFETRKPTRQLVDQVGALQRRQDIRIVALHLDHLPSLNFYVQRNVQNCRTIADVATYLRYPLPVFVFLPAAEWDELRPHLSMPYHELARHPDLYRRDDVVVVTNR